MWSESYARACDRCGVEPRPELANLDGGAFHAQGNTLEFFEHRLTDADLAAILLSNNECHLAGLLNLSYNALSSFCSSELSTQTLSQSLSTVVYLDLSYNSLTGDGIAPLLEVMRDNTSITHLNLSGNPIGGATGPAIATMLESNRTLSTLSLYNTDLDMKGLVNIAQSLETNKGLLSLNIGRNLLPNPDDIAYVVLHLSLVLPRNTSLVELNLSHFGLEDYHLETLAPRICESAVCALIVRGNRLSSASGAILQKLLVQRQKIVMLDLSANRLGDNGVAALAAGVERHHGLRALLLESNGIGARGMEALVKSIDLCQGLDRITLWGNDIDPEAAAHLYSMRDRFRSFKSTDFDFYVVDGKPCVCRK